jgi:glyoxylase-like metal-dependent hydrolase (beta-lactamase superfamily II)
MRELTAGVHSLGNSKGGHVRAFLIDDGGELSLVDTLFEGDAALVLTAIRHLGRSPKDLKRIAITHGHRSHLGGVAALKRASDATVVAHEWEADIVSGDRPAQPVSMRPAQSLRLLPFQLGLRLNRPKHIPCPGDEAHGDGDSFGPLQVLHIPGHSPGHLGFHWAERGFLIAGDAIASWPEICPGWKPFTLNERQHQASLRRMAELEPRVVGVGHGDAITDRARERVHELASQ